MIRGGMTVTVDGYRGVAFRVRSCRGGRAVVVMVGDDRKHEVPESACTTLARKAYCGECGQIGCGHDGRSA